MIEHRQRNNYRIRRHDSSPPTHTQSVPTGHENLRIGIGHIREYYMVIGSAPGNIKAVVTGLNQPNLHQS